MVTDLNYVCAEASLTAGGGVTGVTYGFTAALGGEIHAHLASPRCLILLKKKSQQLSVSNFQI